MARITWFNVYTFDYRGIGQSRPEKIRNLLTDMKDWSKDMDALIGHIARIHHAITSCSDWP
jgi:predicted alpha/beta hydrolase